MDSDSLPRRSDDVRVEQAKFIVSDQMAEEQFAITEAMKEREAEIIEGLRRAHGLDDEGD